MEAVVTSLSTSVIIPTYRRPALLLHALRSVVEQLQAGDEVIVVDDGGGDEETRRTVERFGVGVRYLCTPHLGAGAARNAGVRAATGDTVAFLDDDDEWLPGKLALQKAVMEAFPEILFVFSDFGYITPNGERRSGGIALWETVFLRPWKRTLEKKISSTAIEGLPANAPAFELHIGRFYEEYLWSPIVWTGTLMVRRLDAGDALHFAEDVPLFEDFECYALLARHGQAGFMDCETALERYHLTGPRLTHGDALTKAATDVLIVERVWGADEEYLRDHRADYEAAIDSYRDRKFRWLAGAGRWREAREEVPRFHHPPGYYRFMTHLPDALVTFLLATRRRVRAWR